MKGESIYRIFNIDKDAMSIVKHTVDRYHTYSERIISSAEPHQGTKRSRLWQLNQKGSECSVDFYEMIIVGDENLPHAVDRFRRQYKKATGYSLLSHEMHDERL